MIHTGSSNIEYRSIEVDGVDKEEETDITIRAIEASVKRRLAEDDIRGITSSYLEPSFFGEKVFVAVFVCGNTPTHIYITNYPSRAVMDGCIFEPDHPLK